MAGDERLQQQCGKCGSRVVARTRGVFVERHVRLIRVELDRTLRWAEQPPWGHDRAFYRQRARDLAVHLDEVVAGRSQPEGEGRR